MTKLEYRQYGDTQYAVREVRQRYEEARRERPTLVPFDQLHDDSAFAVIRAYYAGHRDAWGWKEQLEQASKGQQAEQEGGLAAFNRPPQREALFRRMFDAVIRELVPEDGVVEDVFKGIPQHIARMAIADLAASLLVDATDDQDWDEDANLMWTKLVNEIRDEMHETILGLDEEEPLN
jgi:hypothetical protein